MHRHILMITVLVTAFGCGQNDEYADRMAREHRDDAPVANPMSEAAPAAEVVAGEVQYATVDGRPVTGYLARHEEGTGGPALIVIHEWWGLNDNIRAMARRLAGEGYTALAVDLYRGQVADERDAAYQLMKATNAEPGIAEDNLRQADRFLREELDASAVASIGWCFGGAWSLNTALLMPDTLDAAVIYYGHLVDDAERLATLEMPILGLFGAEDQGIPVESVNRFSATLEELGKDATIIVYPGADHAFANPSGHNYQPEAAEAAWQETVAFLAEKLKGGG
jgi:carboxymethylenebutenolidase